MKCGKLWTARIGGPLPEADYYLLAVRYPVQPVNSLGIRNLTHEPTLSPSPELFNFVKACKEKKQWDEDVFHEMFRPRFQIEMGLEPMKSSLSEIDALLMADKDVCILCYCREFNECHRKLLLEYFATGLFEVEEFANRFGRSPIGVR